MTPDHDPYPEEESTVYRYTGTLLRLTVSIGEREYVEEGETVALPDRVADHMADLLDPVESGADPDDDAGEEDAADEEQESPDENPGGNAADSDEDAPESSGEEGGDETAAEDDDVESEDDAEDVAETRTVDDDALAVPDDFGYDLPDDFPTELPEENFPALQKLASANGVDPQQARPDLLDDLAAVRDGGNA